jgi:hypothetical protein
MKWGNKIRVDPQMTQRDADGRGLKREERREKREERREKRKKRRESIRRFLRCSG